MPSKKKSLWCIYIYVLMRLSARSFQAIPKMYKHVLKSIWNPTSHGLTVILLCIFYGVGKYRKVVKWRSNWRYRRLLFFLVTKQMLNLTATHNYWHNANIPAWLVATQLVARKNTHQHQHQKTCGMEVDYSDISTSNKPHDFTSKWWASCQIHQPKLIHSLSLGDHLQDSPIFHGKSHGFHHGFPIDLPPSTAHLGSQVSPSHFVSVDPPPRGISGSHQQFDGIPTPVMVAFDWGFVYSMIGVATILMPKKNNRWITDSPSPFLHFYGW